jgi:hypothetical protein
MNTGDFLPDAETPLFNTFHFFPFPKTLQSAVSSSFFITETTPSSTCFAFLPSVAETPLPTTFHFSPFPLLKHRYQQPFIIFPDAETPLFSIFHFFPLPKHSSPPFSHYFHCRNNSVQHLFRHHYQFFSVAETPLSATLHFSHPPSSTKQFRPAIVSPLSVAETPFASNPSSFIHDAETPPFNTFSFSSDTETPVISSSSSTTIVSIFSVTETPAFHHRPSASFYALKC